MRRVVTRVGVLALVAAGTVALTVGSAGAARSTQSSSPDVVTVQFRVKGDLVSLEGRLHDFNCVERVQPNTFRVPGGFALVSVEVVTFKREFPPCDRNEAIWLLVTQPKSRKDPPETMGVRLRYGSRPTTVEFLHPSKDLRWTSRVIDRAHVEVDITGT